MLPPRRRGAHRRNSGCRLSRVAEMRRHREARRRGAPSCFRRAPRAGVRVQPHVRPGRLVITQPISVDAVLREDIRRAPIVSSVTHARPWPARTLPGLSPVTTARGPVAGPRWRDIAQTASIWRRGGPGPSTVEPPPRTPSWNDAYPSAFPAASPRCRVSSAANLYRSSAILGDVALAGTGVVPATIMSLLLGVEQLREWPPG